MLRLLLGGPAESVSREGDPLHDELEAAKRHIGELAMANELLREEVGLRRPFVKRRSRK